jgi:hypothetical protein
VLDPRLLGGDSPSRASQSHAPPQHHHHHQQQRAPSPLPTNTTNNSTTAPPYRKHARTHSNASFVHDAAALDDDIHSMTNNGEPSYVDPAAYMQQPMHPQQQQQQQQHTGSIMHNGSIMMQPMQPMPMQPQMFGGAQMDDLYIEMREDTSEVLRVLDERLSEEFNFL